MNFSDKLQVLRKSNGIIQEELANKLNVSHQAIAKWENGQSYPDISNLILISEILNVTIDYLVKNEECNITPKKLPINIVKLIEFRLEANVNTYAAKKNEVKGTRMDSHDFHYEKGEYSYHDTYVGGEQFAGTEGVWHNGIACYAMNYVGRTLSDKFSGNFLKEALMKATCDMPYRGPRFYQAGEYVYQTKVTGDINWFQGIEEIYCNNELVYECYYHGGLIH